MAKSARASSRKTNNTAIRKKVFAPVEDARAKRLSAKLQELAAQPKPLPNDMEVEKPVTDAESSLHGVETREDMEIDSAGNKDVSKTSNSYKKTPSRIQKKRRGKPHAQMVFKKGKKKGGKK